MAIPTMFLQKRIKVEEPEIELVPISSVEVTSGEKLPRKRMLVKIGMDHKKRRKNLRSRNNKKGANTAHGSRDEHQVVQDKKGKNVSCLESENKSLQDDFEKIKKTWSLLDNIEQIQRQYKEHSLERDQFKEVYIKKEPESEIAAEIVPENTNDSCKEKVVNSDRSPVSSLNEPETMEERNSEHDVPDPTLPWKGKRGCKPKPEPLNISDPDQDSLQDQCLSVISLLKRDFQEIESRYKQQSIKIQVLTKSVLDLETEKESLRHKNASLEKKLAMFEKNNNEMNAVISKLEKNNAELLFKIGELKKAESYRERVAELECENKIMIEENEAMLKEVKEFMTNNKRMNQVILDQDNHIEKISVKLEAVQKELRAKCKEIIRLDDIKNFLQKKCDVEIKTKDAKIEWLQNLVADADKVKAENEAQISELQMQTKNFKKSFSEVLKCPKKLAKLQKQKLVVGENKALAESIMDIEKIVEELVNNEESSNIHIKITKMK